MKVDVKLLAENLSRQEEDAAISRDGVNGYLIDSILFPSMDGRMIHLGDIDFDAFDLEDIEALGEFYSEIMRRTEALKRFAENVDGVAPAAANYRSFC